MKKNERDICCCFSGHRPEKLTESEHHIKRKLEAAIEDAIDAGYTTFISGLARGTDIWTARIVLKKRKRDKSIKLICAIPYDGFEKRWDETDKFQYRDIMKKADYVKYVCEHYSKTCFQLRNKFMIDHSSRLIAVYNGSGGGTRNTINYAKRQGIEIINVLSEKEAD